MAIHTELPIYKSSYDLLGLVLDAVSNMPRDFKTTVSRTFLEECIAITTLIGRTNRAEKGEARAPILDELLERVQGLETLLRVATEKGKLPRGQYGVLIKLTQSICRQASGWKKSSTAAPVASTSRRQGQSAFQPGRAAGS